MKLSEKGRYAPPPRLPQHAQAVADAIASWPLVHTRTHWLLGDETEVDGADFYVEEEELGHLHLEGEAHIAMPKPLRDALIGAGLASPFAYSPRFVVFSVEKARDVAAATRLFRLAYEALQGVSAKELAARVTERRA